MNKNKKMNITIVALLLIGLFTIIYATLFTSHLSFIDGLIGPILPAGRQVREQPSHDVSHQDSEGMDLLQPVAMIRPEQQQMIGVRTDLVKEMDMEKVIRAVGRIGYDERHITHVNLKIEGWIGDLFVDYVGRPVKKGEPLFNIYSPELVSAQEEYLLALKGRETLKESPLQDILHHSDSLVESARKRLLLWNMTEKEIDALKNRGGSETYVTIYAPADGIVIKKEVYKGMHVTPDITLYEIADTRVVWVNADIYEHEAPFVKVGDMADITLSYIPGVDLRGRVVYIYPYLNPETRTVRIRIELPSRDGTLKPDMYTNVEIRAKIGRVVALPEAAVIDSGTRRLVFIDKGDGIFEPREIKAGARIEGYYIVEEGVASGEKIVTSANFLIDSESKLAAAAGMKGAMGLVGMADVQMRQAKMGGMEGVAVKPTSVRQEKKVGEITIEISSKPDPPKAGEVLFIVKLTDKEGNIIRDAKVGLIFKMAMPGMAPVKTTGQLSKEGPYEAKASLPMSGEWDLMVSILMPGKPEIKEMFKIMVGM